MFVVHSLGGLVVKKSLCLSASQNQERLKRIGQCTRAIAFLGTPHRGSDLAAFSKSIAKILKALGKRTNKDILGVLEPNSRHGATMRCGQTIPSTAPRPLFGFRQPISLVTHISTAG